MEQTTHIQYFYRIFLFIIIIGHLYVYARLVHGLRLTCAAKKRLALSLALLAGLTLATRHLDYKWEEPFAWAARTWAGLLILLLLFLLLTDLLWLFYKALPGKNLQNPERRIFLQKAFCLSALNAAGMSGGFSLWNCLRPVSVKPVSISLKRLPGSLDGLSIVQITDLHVSPIISRGWLERIVGKVNALQPDIVVVTGDLVDGSVEDLKNIVEPIADLKAGLGVYFVTGNHEYFTNVGAWCAHLTSLGVRVLRNERITINTQGESFDLAGVDDFASSRYPGQGPDLPKALEDLDPNKLLILLAHQPAAIYEAAVRDVDLQLSGHTHGGQIWPFGYFIYLLQPYIKGLHRHGDFGTQIYVSQGTGFWGPPMRFGTSAEITRITLRSA